VDDDYPQHSALGVNLCKVRHALPQKVMLPEPVKV
jgi:hypothetical protein